MRTLLAITILVGFSARAHAEADDGANKPTEDDKTAIAVKKALEEDRKVRRAQEDADRKVKQEREVAEAAYKKEAVVFRDFVVASMTNNSVTSVANATVAYRNGRKLSTEEFYVAVDRPDLAAVYQRRTKIGWTVVLTGAAAMIAGSAYLLAASPKRAASTCDFTQPDFLACSDREDSVYEAKRNRVLTTSLALSGGGLIVNLVGFYIIRSRNPSSVNEAHDMADAHNAKLRKKHGLSTAHVAPYATPDGGGVAMVGRF